MFTDSGELVTVDPDGSGLAPRELKMIGAGQDYSVAPAPWVCGCSQDRPLGGTGFSGRSRRRRTAIRLNWRAETTGRARGPAGEREPVGPRGKPVLPGLR
jgi:hypothetical protein